jgi:magnesium-transporting ATPase (P-type)
MITATTVHRGRHRQISARQSSGAVTGTLNRIGPSELAALVDQVSVYARVSPEMCASWTPSGSGRVVAMTDDSVNDAAAEKADIGVA